MPFVFGVLKARQEGLNLFSLDFRLFGNELTSLKSEVLLILFILLQRGYMKMWMLFIWLIPSQTSYSGTIPLALLGFLQRWIRTLVSNFYLFFFKV